MTRRPALPAPAAPARFHSRSPSCPPLSGVVPGAAAGSVSGPASASVGAPPSGAAHSGPRRPLTSPRSTLPRALAALSLLALVAACGSVRESRLNPFNWFGRSEPRAERVVLPEKPADPRSLVSTVLSMEVDRLSSGAIVRATGLPPSQGYWDAELVAQPVTESGTLVLEFRIFPPVAPQPQGTQVSREVVVATHLSNIRLRDVREIVVQGAENARAVRR
ncbi:hypothetical protein [Pseudogemmobacter sonorensis]|uniref:hypothetical protein n=1 Tax=Pseudogemmobacter sonorensis TaxID=2989681 RepID=UPI0036CF15D3